MNKQIRAIQTYFSIYSVVAPKMAARSSFKVFQKVRKKSIRPREAFFFDKTTKATLAYDSDTVDYYTLGNPAHPLVFLVHGWDSNAGSLSKIADKLLEMDRYVIALNLPGHAFSKKSSTNLLECKQAFKALLTAINPTEPFSVISHSFGSGVAAFALSETDYKVENLIFLTNPNRVEHIFEAFKDMIHLGPKAYTALLQLVEFKLGETIADVSVENKLKKVDFKSLVLIHDKYDKVLSYEHSVEVKKAFPAAEIVTFEKIGHYKMLWNEEVINACALRLN